MKIIIFMKIYIISTFRSLEYQESAESTKPYQSLHQVSVSGARNHFFVKINIFVKFLLFDAKRSPRKKVPLSAKPEIAAAGTCGKVDFALLFVL